MYLTVDPSDFEAAGRELATALSQVQDALDAALPELARMVGEPAAEELRLVTPVAEDREETRPDRMSSDASVPATVQGGALAASTHSVPEAIDSAGLIIDLVQDALSEDGVLYGFIVRTGRRGFGPKTKKALAGPGFGPVMRVGPADPNPYPLLATQSISAVVETITETWGDEVVSQLLEGI